MVLLEALAAKNAVIASNVGAIPKVIKHNRTGLLVEPRNVNDLSRNLLTLLNDSVKAEQLGRAGHLRVTQYFSSNVMTERYINLYRAMTNRG